MICLCHLPVLCICERKGQRAAPGGHCGCGWAECWLLELTRECRHPWLVVPATDMGPSAASGGVGGLAIRHWGEDGACPENHLLGDRA